ncbi:hypothetical protein NE237_032294 [Protea cynaroides]|uniref:Uncharacterized protein n=1 Tax=Protea cynaroides TaxID=273540 RepID=A0A9Q0L2U9_9MAGN|nr:hypothetical protein NE237_032294 [Protea cynaroides]
MVVNQAADLDGFLEFPLEETRATHPVVGRDGDKATGAREGLMEIDAGQGACSVICHWVRPLGAPLLAELLSQEGVAAFGRLNQVLSTVREAEATNAYAVEDLQVHPSMVAITGVADQRMKKEEVSQVIKGTSAIIAYAGFDADWCLLRWGTSKEVDGLDSLSVGGNLSTGVRSLVITLLMSLAMNSAGVPSADVSFSHGRMDVHDVGVQEGHGFIVPPQILNVKVARVSIYEGASANIVLAPMERVGGHGDDRGLANQVLPVKNVLLHVAVWRESAMSMQGVNLVVRENGTLPLSSHVGVGFSKGSANRDLLREIQSGLSEVDAIGVVALEEGFFGFGNSELIGRIGFWI